MNFEAITSWLTHANWYFLAVWIALLAAAVAASFPQAPAPGNGQRADSDRASCEPRSLHPSLLKSHLLPNVPEEPPSPFSIP